MQPLKAEVGFALAAFILIGLSDFFRKKGMMLAPSPASYYLVETFVALAAAITLNYFLEGWRISLTGDALIYPLLSGISIALGIVLMMYGLRAGEASVVIPIARLSLALTALLGIFILGEAVTLKKMAGIALAVTAIYLLST